MEESRINVAIATEDEQILTELTAELGSDTDFNIQSTSADAAETMDHLEAGGVTILLLDTLLPGGSTAVLNGIKNLDQKPISIVLGRPGQKNAVQDALQVGADYFLDSCAGAAGKVKQIYGIKNGLHYNNAHQSAKRNFAASVLDSIPISNTLKGYRYLLEGICEMIDDTSLKKAITKQLYPYIAKKYESTPSRVERSMRNAIEIAWKNGANSNWCKLTGRESETSRKPTNGAFIYTIAQLYTSHA